MTFMTEPTGSTLSVSVTQNTAGVAGRDMAYIEIDGVVSPGIKSGATADEVCDKRLYKILSCNLNRLKETQ